MFDAKHFDTILTFSLSSQAVKKAAPTEPTPQKVPKAKEEKVRKQPPWKNFIESNSLIYSNA